MILSMISIKKQNDSQKEPLQWKLLARWCFDSLSIKCPLKSPETVADAAAESQQILPSQKHTSAGSRQLNASLPESKAMPWHCFRLRPPNTYEIAQVNHTYGSDSLAVKFDNQNVTAIIIVCINKFQHPGWIPEIQLKSQAPTLATICQTGKPSWQQALLSWRPC